MLSFKIYNVIDVYSLIGYCSLDCLSGLKYVAHIVALAIILDPAGCRMSNTNVISLRLFPVYTSRDESHPN